MAMPARPARWGITPETPNFGGVQSDLEPVVANEQDVARSLLQPVKDVLEGDVPSEDIAKYFWREFGNV